tara:strand:+ start:7989 stop:10790 length:2802 start_codon:yes stop_codon:yes gene_type:complete
MAIKEKDFNSLLAKPRNQRKINFGYYKAKIEFARQDKDHLIISGSSEGLVLSGSNIVFDGKLTGSVAAGTAASASSFLALNSDNEIIKAAVSGGERSVSGDTDNGVITWVTSDNTFAVESNFTYDGTDLAVTLDTATFTSANSADPLIVVKNTNSDTNCARLQFVKDKGAAGADGDDIGAIEFVGDDAAQTQTTFAKILAEVSEADDSDEAGKLSLFVAESDGTTTTLTAGLILEGEHATDGEVDVTIGAGAGSTVTVPGNINVSGEVQTANIGYTDGDNSMTIADGGKVTFAAGFAVGSDAAGDMLYHNGTSYVRFAKGSADQVLTMNDAASAPGWEDPVTGMRSVSGDTDNGIITWVTSDNTFAVESNLTFDGTDLGVAAKVFHLGDTDTYINFTDDDINIQCGGVNFVDFTEDSQNDITFNEGGVDIDFRIESADETHMFFMEASSNRISIGDNTGSPGATLEVKNNASAGAFGVPLVQLNSNDTDQQCLDINASNITANVVNITANDVTTARVLAIGADGLTTGNALYVDDNSSDTGTRNTALIIQNNAAAIAATAFTVQSDGGVTGIKLDKNYSDTTEASITGLHIDWDKTGASTSDNTMYGIYLDMDNTTATNGNNYMYGLHVTPTLTHAADAGGTFVYGALINAQGGTNGSSLVQGARIEAGGGDTNFGLQLDVEDGGVDLRIESSADNGDYFQIQTTTHGATTITTVDDDASNANLQITADGTAELAGTVVTLDSAAAVNIESDALNIGNDGDTDVVVSFKGNTSDGSITWKEDESEFHFSDPIKGKYLYFTHHNFNYTGTAKIYLPINSPVENTDITYVFVHMIAPYDGKLVKVIINADGDHAGGGTAPGSTVVGLHLDQNTTAATTVTETLAQSSAGVGVTQTFNFTSSNTFSKNQFLSISVDANAQLYDARATCVWEYDTTT